MPQHFTWDNTTRHWNIRANSQIAIGRMPFINPSKQNLFQLASLLCHIRGPNSFEDLKTVRGVTHKTYKEAAVALGLAENDKQTIETMEEAASKSMPRQCRQVFAMLLIHNSPVNPDQLWTRYKKILSDDFTHRSSKSTRAPLSQTEAERKAFWIISFLCTQHYPDIDLLTILNVNYEPFPDHVNFYSDEEWDAKQAKETLAFDVGRMNAEQKHAYFPIARALSMYKNPFSSSSQSTLPSSTPRSISPSRFLLSSHTHYFYKHVYIQ
jgi:hypothetical protein